MCVCLSYSVLEQAYTQHSPLFQQVDDILGEESDNESEERGKKLGEEEDEEEEAERSQAGASRTPKGEQHGSQALGTVVKERTETRWSGEGSPADSVSRYPQHTSTPDNIAFFKPQPL